MRLRLLNFKKKISDFPSLIPGAGRDEVKSLLINASDPETIQFCKDALIY